MESMNADQYLHNLPKLDRQQQAFVHSYANLHNVGAAANAAGITRATALRWMKTDAVADNLDFYENEALIEHKVSRDKLTAMLFEAHRKSATSTEEVAAIRELGKMHGVYEPEKTVTVSANYTKIEQMEELSDDELIAIINGA